MRRIFGFAALTGFIISMANFSPSFAGPNAGDPAPDFTLPDSGGTFHSLSDFVGKVVVLDFWQGH